MYGTCVCYVMSQFFFCSSMVKSEPTWLRPEKLRLEEKKKKRKKKKKKKKRYFCCINIDRTTTRSLQMKIFVHFLTFSGLL